MNSLNSYRTEINNYSLRVDSNSYSNHACGGYSSLRDYSGKGDYSKPRKY